MSSFNHLPEHSVERRETFFAGNTQHGETLEYSHIPTIRRMYMASCNADGDVNRQGGRNVARFGYRVMEKRRQIRDDSPPDVKVCGDKR